MRLISEAIAILPVDFASDSFAAGRSGASVGSPGAVGAPTAGSTRVSS